MSTKTCLWALAFTFTSLLSAAAPAADQAAKGPSVAVASREAQVRQLELEAEAAASPDLYLLLSLDPAVLRVKARGVELDRVDLGGVALLEHRAFPSGASGPSLEGPDPEVSSPEVPDSKGPILQVPAEWRVEARPPDPSRKILAPPVLRSWSGEEDESPAASPSSTSQSSAAPPALPEPPDEYTVLLSGGWSLEVGRSVAGPGLGARLATAVADGWAALLGNRPERPPVIRLAIGSEDARRLHHLFRRDTRLLLVVTAP